MARKHDLFLVRIRLRDSFDYRPCIILHSSAQTSSVVLLSSALGLRRDVSDFLISSDDPDFAKTGLKKSSYALGDQIHEMNNGELKHKLGSLEGELAERFDKWLD